ncbi:MAG: hypothetical protein CVU57_12780 [Deltaproteobacteria bacterium HGW-Deltaproteobacteria-15]|jgi:hypothetical protein|nr:MAG: hypothetical protein CVU57_12780 [Deltaproteobacteria bacterium HGW-Deltaproteobacteria-15]
MLVKRQIPQLAISNQQSARSLAAGAARLIEQETFVFFLAYRTRNPADPVILSKTFHTSSSASDRVQDPRSRIQDERKSVQIREDPCPKTLKFHADG